MASRLEKIAFMSRKLFRDLTRDAEIYRLSEDLHSLQLGEYYFLMDEKELLAGHSQDFHFDEDGIPIIPSYIDVAEPRMIYYPISIGQWGLAVYHTWLRTRAAADKHRFMVIVDWFYDNSIEDEKGVYWLTDVPKPEYRINQPWPSAFAQSRGISILLRGWQITRLHKYLDAAKEAIKIFEIPAAEGGVTTFTDVGPFYEEYPAPFPTMVLDGFFFSLCGLYDLVRVLRHPKAKELFDAGVRSAKAWLPRYDLGWWMRYNYCREPFYPDPDPATIGYLRLVVTQLRLFHKLTGDVEFLRWAEHFKSYDRPRNILRMYAVKYRALKQLNRL
ncbi:MAG: D-glucuronyl C5-epimerase family protein [candidate division KSB1 bacterium]|nr:D-glucuronyl C5-epimerase family protein [candidate division KSB1 bacterium]